MKKKLTLGDKKNRNVHVGGPAGVTVQFSKTGKTARVRVVGERISVSYEPLDVVIKRLQACAWLEDATVNSDEDFCTYVLYVEGYRPATDYEVELAEASLLKDINDRAAADKAKKEADVEAAIELLKRRAPGVLKEDP